jgi:casein kinase 1
MKVETTPEELCMGLPSEFLKFLKYVRNLPFEAKPSYSLIKNWLKSILEKRGEQYDPYYDWVNKRLGKSISSKAYADGFAPKIKR